MATVVLKKENHVTEHFTAATENFIIVMELVSNTAKFVRTIRMMMETVKQTVMILIVKVIAQQQNQNAALERHG